MLTKLIAKYCPVDGVDPSDLQVLKIKLVVKVPPLNGGWLLNRGSLKIRIIFNRRITLV